MQYITLYKPCTYFFHRTASWSSELLKSSKLIGRSGQTLREQLRQAMLEQKAGIAISDESVPLVIEKDIDELPPMPEMVYTDNTAAEEAVVGSALKQSVNGGLPLTMRKRKKKQSTIPKIAKKRYKQRTGMDSDSSFDSSDSGNDEDEDEDEGPRTIAEPLDEVEDSGPTQIEAVTEAAKDITVEVVRREEEEFDDIKAQLLKSNREGDLAGDIAKVKRRRRRRVSLKKLLTYRY